MSIGLGILLIVIGAIFEWVLEVSIPGIDRYLLGWILMIAGAAIVIISLILGAVRGRSRVVTETRDVNGDRRVSTTRQEGGDYE